MSDRQQNMPKWPPAGENYPPSYAREKESALTRFLGGSPLAVFTRLVFISLLVGAFLYWLNIRPRDIIDELIFLANHIYAMGFDAVREVGSYIAAGALIVVPVWLVMRLLSAKGAR
jgi:hypothetical protein